MTLAEEMRQRTKQAIEKRDSMTKKMFPDLLSWAMTEIVRAADNGYGYANLDVRNANLETKYRCPGGIKYIELSSKLFRSLIDKQFKCSTTDQNGEHIHVSWFG